MFGSIISILHEIHISVLFIKIKEKTYYFSLLCILIGVLYLVKIFNLRKKQGSHLPKVANLMIIY